MRKNVILPHKLLNRNINESFISDPVNIQYLDNIGIQLIVSTSANTGIFTIEASIDGVTYDTLTLSPVIPALANANTTITINLNQVPFTWLRIKFTIGTGTAGTVAGYITAKEL